MASGLVYDLALVYGLALAFFLVLVFCLAQVYGPDLVFCLVSVSQGYQLHPRLDLVFSPVSTCDQCSHCSQRWRKDSLGADHGAWAVHSWLAVSSA